MTLPDAVPVLEIGGTHVTAVLVEVAGWSTHTGSLTRLPLRSGGTVDELLDDIASAANTLGDRHQSDWAVAIPGPFDYAVGIARYEHVGKFDNLFGVNLRDALGSRIRPAPGFIHFLNDADAFGVGEYAVGAARGHDRAVCITLGSGVGSAFLDCGEPVNTGPAVPPDGSLHLLSYRGRPLEETVSRRAIRASYATATSTPPGTVPDVHEIAERARLGDTRALRVLHQAFAGLGAALGGAISAFEASILVVGGSVANSWDLVGPALREGLSISMPSMDSLAIQPAARPDDAAILGAAYWATGHAK